MTQVFRDLAREAWEDSGSAGLARLWSRTLVDVLVSVGQAYAEEVRKTMFRIVVAVGLLYVGSLALANGYGAIMFGEFYDPPAFSRFGAAGADEDTLVAAYERALTGEYGRYRTFVVGTGFGLAILLGIGSAIFGRWQRSLLHGAGAFALGSALTIVSLSLLPTVWFPLDRYSVAALWVMGGGLPLAAGAWLLATAVGRFVPGRERFKTA
jgi:hypothetical protein